MKTPRNGKRIVRAANHAIEKFATAESIEPRLLMSAAVLALTDIAQFSSSLGHGAAAGVIRDTSGNLYGTTTLGGTNNLGTVYKVANGSGAITTIASFTSASGCNPTADLVMDAAGNLYGTTPYGGANNLGTVYEVAAGGSSVTRLASFTSAANDLASVKLVVDSHGNLFGTTPFGGTQSEGSIFEIVEGSGSITTLTSFGNATGAFPSSGLVRDSAGNLYGTTPRYGPDGYGTIYELPFNTSSISVLAPFASTNGVEQTSAPVIDSTGNIFGTTQLGGVNGDGSVYELPARTSTILTLASFNSSNGANPSSPPALDASGNLFGTTPNGGPDGYGTVWELPSGSNTIAAVAAFTLTNGSAGTDGYSHNAIMPGIVSDSHGNFYGVAPGGAPGGLGSVYYLTPAESITDRRRSTAASGVPEGTPQSITFDMETPGGAIDPTSHAAVTLSLLASPPGGSISGSLSMSAVNGVAAFTNVIFNEIGNYTLQASSTGLSSALIGPISVTAGAASTLVITQQPTGAAAGQTIGSAVVEIEDGHGNVITTDTSTVNIAATNGTTLNGTTAVQAVAGVATLSGISINKAGTYTLSMTDGALASVNTSSFVITAGPASELVVSQQPPATATAGKSIGSVNVDVADAFGNIITSDSSTVTVSVSGTATLNGTLSQPDQAGIAAFGDLSITTAGAYTLTFTDGSLTATTTSSFNIIAAASSQLVISQQPTTASAGQVMGSVLVQVEDAYGNVASADQSSVTIAANTPRGLTGTTTQTVQSGVATFANLSISTAGTYTLTATHSALTPAISAPITVAAAVDPTPTPKPSPNPKPSPTPTPTPIPLQPIVAIAGMRLRALVIDSNTDFDRSPNSSRFLTVTIQSQSSNNIPILTRKFAVRHGLAKINNLRILIAGSYTLLITDAFGNTLSDQITILPASPAELQFVTEPTTVEGTSAVMVRAVDAYGNLTPAADGTIVHIRLGWHPLLGRKPTFTGPTTAALVNGIATFANLAIANKGRARLFASAMKLRSVQSSVFVNE